MHLINKALLKQQEYSAVYAERASAVRTSSPQSKAFKSAERQP
jgi:hypothetical protein